MRPTSIQGKWDQRTSRRTLITWLSVAGAAALQAACSAGPASPAAPAPTAAPKGTAPASTGAGGASSAPSQAPAKAQSLTKIKYGVVKVSTQSVQAPFYFMAREKGFFRDQGLDVEYVEIVSGDTITKGVIADEIDVGIAGPAPVFTADEQGASVKVIASILPKSAFNLYANKAVKSVKELEGKTLGTGGPGSVIDVLTDALLQKEGVDLDKVTKVNIGTSVDVFRAVIAGKVDAGMAPFEFALQLGPDSDIYPLVDTAAALPDYLFQAVFARSDTIEQKRDAMIGMLTAIAQGVRYTLDHQDESVALASRVTGRPAEEVKPGFDIFVQKKVYNPNIDFTPAAVEYTQQLSVGIGAQKTVLPFDRVATLDLQKQVIARLGPYKGS